MRSNDSAKESILARLVSGTSPKLDETDIPEARASREKCQYRDVQLQRQEKEALRYVACRFNQITLEGCHFRKLHFERCVMDTVRLVDCNINELELVNCEINNLEVVSSKMAQCLFRESALQSVQWRDSLIDGLSFNQSTMQNIQLSRLRMSHWLVSGCEIQQLVIGESTLYDASWVNSQLREGCFKAVDIRRQVMAGSQLSNVWFEVLQGTQWVWCECLLDRVVLAGAPLTGATLLETTLNHCDLRKSQLSYATLSRSTLNDCRLMQADLTSCRAEDAVFNRCDLSQTRLKNSRLNGVKLAGCEVEGSDFSGADLRSATFSEGSLRAASNWQGVCLHGAKGAGVPLPPPEPLLLRIDEWYQLNQPGRSEVALASSPRGSGGGSRYVQIVIGTEVGATASSGVK